MPIKIIEKLLQKIVESVGWRHHPALSGGDKIC